MDTLYNFNVWSLTLPLKFSILIFFFFSGLHMGQPLLQIVFKTTASLSELLKW